MSANRQNNPVESVLNAAVGYTTVILGIICFLLTLVVVIAGVRIVAGMSIAATANPNQTTVLTSAGQSETA